MGNDELYAVARTILNKWHSDKSWREIAQMLHVPDDKIDSYAAQFNAISRGHYNHPRALIAMQLITPTKKIPTCPDCGKVHGRFKTCDDKRISPTRTRFTADIPQHLKDDIQAERDRLKLKKQINLLKKPKITTSTTQIRKI